MIDRRPWAVAIIRPRRGSPRWAIAAPPEVRMRRKAEGKGGLDRLDRIGGQIDGAVEGEIKALRLGDQVGQDGGVKAAVGQACAKDNAGQPGGTGGANVAHASSSRRARSKTKLPGRGRIIG